MKSSVFGPFYKVLVYVHAAILLFVRKTIFLGLKSDSAERTKPQRIIKQALDANQRGEDFLHAGNNDRIWRYLGV
jgi:hypothetical protein